MIEKCFACEAVAIVEHSLKMLDYPDHQWNATMCQSCFSELLVWLAQKAGKVEETIAVIKELEGDKAS